MAPAPVWLMPEPVPKPNDSPLILTVPAALESVTVGKVTFSPVTSLLELVTWPLFKSMAAPVKAPVKVWVAPYARLKIVPEVADADRSMAEAGEVVPIPTLPAEVTVKEDEPELFT